MCLVYLFVIKLIHFLYAFFSWPSSRRRNIDTRGTSISTSTQMAVVGRRGNTVTRRRAQRAPNHMETIMWHFCNWLIVWLNSFCPLMFYVFLYVIKNRLTPASCSFQKWVCPGECASILLYLPVRCVCVYFAVLYCRDAFTTAPSLLELGHRFRWSLWKKSIDWYSHTRLLPLHKP